MALLLIASSDGSATQEYQLRQPVTMIGRYEENDIVLSDMTVSGRHAMIRLDKGKFLIEDLGSSNGTIVNQVRVERKFLRHNDKIILGKHTIVFNEKSPASLDQFSEPAGAVEKEDASLSSTPDSKVSTEVIEYDTKQMATFSDEDPIDSDIYLDFRRKARNLLIKRMNLTRSSIESISRKESHERAKVVAEQILLEMKDEMPKGIPRDAIVQDMLNDALGLGVLEDLLQDSTVTEIMVNSREEIYVERGGKIYRTKKRFLSDTQVRHVIDRMVTPTGRRIDESSPIIDVRLQDGSHVNAIIPPLAIKGPCITIRKFSEKHYTVEDLIYFGTLTRGMADFFRICVETRQNIFVSGETGTGKTTLLNVLSSYIPSNERIITVEEASELSLSQEHVVSLAASFPNSKDKRTMNIRDLFRNALRMRPHRIVLGECRGGEALDLLQAMNTGHSGSLTTVNANSPQDIIARLETMVITAGIELPSKVLRQQIATAVNIIIHLSNYADGTRKVTNVVKVAGMDGDTVTMQDIFTYHQEGMSEDGRVIGKYIASGFFVKFVEQLRNKGIEIPLSMLQNDT